MQSTPKKPYILGISAFFHDSAACLMRGEEIIACAQEERFSRKKHDEKFPSLAIEYVLSEAKITLQDVDFVGFFEKPFLKFERLIETYLAEAPRGFKSFATSMPIWLKHKLFLKETILRELAMLQAKLTSNAIDARACIKTTPLKEELSASLRGPFGTSNFGKISPDNSVSGENFASLSVQNGSRIEAESFKTGSKFKKSISKKILFAEHHQSHAASCFFPSPFQDAAILTMDGVGEWTTTSIAHGSDNQIKFLKEVHFPHSLGLFYSAFTYYLGFKVNSGEYKVMGLAPYGKPVYVDLIKKDLIDIKNDGSFRLNMKFFSYLSDLRMVNEKFEKLFGTPRRKSESELTQFHMDIASSLQAITEEIMIKLATTARKITGSKNLVMAGGVALNCVGNGKILREKIFDKIWIQPAAGDAGGALGAAQSIFYQHLLNPRNVDDTGRDSIKGSYLGKKYENSEVRQKLDLLDAKYLYVESEEQLLDIISENLANQKVVGWHQGRMEFGPRALGARSIIGDSRSQTMQSVMNLKIKYRESFRPFAPAILKEKVADYFEIDCDSPYMLMVAQVKKEKCNPMTKEQEALFGIEKLNISRSEIPAVTHVDYSARIQTVELETNPRFYRLLQSFEKKTGCPVLINTSFNVRGEPIVCSPIDSYKCFMRTKMDILVIENFILFKEDQPNFNDSQNWQSEYELD